MWKKTIATVSIAVATFVGGVVTATPANAVGTKNGKCTHYDSFVGTSSATGTSFTSGEKKLCGQVKIRVGYNVSGGSTQYTAWKQGAGSISQAPVGYKVFGGEHTVTDPAPVVGNPLIRS